MNKINIFLKGVLMGICDAVPGISGGTIAFITGIYERLINAIKGFSLSLVKGSMLLIVGGGDRKKLKEDVKKLDLGFLVPLMLGILVALVLFARVMSFLLDNYFSLTMAFFVGLILASSKTIYNHIEKHHTTNVVLAFIGLALGISLAFLIPSNIDPSIEYVFLGGFVAVSAMILPGISGSFILLVMGIYGFLLNVVNNIFSNYEYVIVFIVGAVLGLVVMSRIVSYLFKKDKSKTLYFLLGLVIGGLSVPIKGILESGIDFGYLAGFAHLMIFLLGIIVSFGVTHFSKGKYLVKNI